MHRIFITNDQLSQSRIILDQDTVHHLFNVCRLTLNSNLEIVIHQSRLMLVSIEKIHDNGFSFAIQDQWSLSQKRKIPVTLIQSLPKQDKLTEICRMCTELGVDSIQPVVTEFCDVKQLSENKLKRSISAIQSAAKQSKQNHVPTLHTTKKLTDALSDFRSQKNILKLVAYENSSNMLYDVISKKPERMIIAIGPEGGYSEKDIAQFKEYGYIPFSLGSHILRTEHAGFASICYLDGFLESL